MPFYKWPARTEIELAKQVFHNQPVIMKALRASCDLRASNGGLITTVPNSAHLLLQRIFSNQQIIANALVTHKQAKDLMLPCLKPKGFKIGLSIQILRNQQAIYSIVSDGGGLPETIPRGRVRPILRQILKNQLYITKAFGRAGEAEMARQSPSRRHSSCTVM